MFRASLLERFPELARDWHPARNAGLTPADVAATSRKVVWWKCPKGTDHEWQTQVLSRSVAPGCPFCLGRRASRAHSLARKHPELARQWHPSKNGALRPKDVPPSSNKRVWWKCPNAPDHEWQSSPGARVRYGGCPFCSGQRTAPSASLLVQYPELARQWHPRKNGALSPADVLPGSERTIWWKCPKGPDHEWRSTPASRTQYGKAQKCPFCKNLRVSVTNSLATRRPEIARQWHPSKNGALSAAEVSVGTERKVWWKCPKASDHVWQSRVAVRVKHPRCPFCISVRASKSNSLATHYPALARQWHPTKNGKLTPAGITAHSNRRVFWKCSKGPDHEWQTTVANRHHTGCPFCAGRKVSVTNRLDRVAPALAKEWHPSKNGRLTPQQITAGTQHSVWWQCKRGVDHVWRTDPKTRMQGSGCPFCAGKRASKTTSLAFRKPAVARLWHPTQNAELRPSDVTPGSDRVVWWKCPKGRDHEWQTSVAYQSRRGCPFCDRRRVSITNSLAATNPDVARLWHPTKNGRLTPADVLSGSSKQVWWKCPAGPDHVWECTVHYIVALGCPFCRGARASVTNSLATKAPRVARYWHPTKNAPLTPRDVTPGSNRYVWWLCDGGPDHEWQGYVRDRVKRPKCPFCTGVRLSVTNSLAALFPRIAAEWDPTRNGRRTPEAVFAAGADLVWWRCRLQHVYRARVRDRTARRQGCPLCAEL